MHTYMNKQFTHKDDGIKGYLVKCETNRWPIEVKKALINLSITITVAIYKRINERNNF